MSDIDVARHLTAVRALVLQILSAMGPLTREGILCEWERRRPYLGAGHRERLPRMRDETLWRLTNLGWVARKGAEYHLTNDGEIALRCARGPSRADVARDLPPHS